jgi:hypothetical protein
MRLLTKSFHWLLKQRLNRLQVAINNPIERQYALLKELIQKGKHTLYGKQLGYSTIDSPQAFQRQVPICTYEQLYPYIAQALQGIPQVLWPTPIKWFAKSSGTTNDRSKYIPVSEEALQEGHYKAGKDMLSIYLANNPESKLAQGKSLAMAGSLYSNSFSTRSNTQYGDVSAVIMWNLPFWARWISTPSVDITLLEDWEEKLEKLAQATVQENITAITGIPTWVLLLLNRVVALKQATSIAEVWPMLELFIHGGVSFTPYKDLFDQLVPAHMHYMEVYNASEGFFAVQDQLGNPGLLLLIDHGIYYEFIPIEDIDKPSKQALDLSSVELNKIYALVITTNSGLWRYQIGDTVKFTSLSPYRIQVIGRTKHFINTFGEELMIHHAEAAISHACALTGATISDYTVGPFYLSNGQQGKHEWVIEFVRPPAQLHEFREILDHQLQAINSDYEAKRYKDMLLTKPIINPVPPGFFYTWMKKQDKLGEQHKVPRLFNSRKYLDSIHQLLQETDSSRHYERMK